MTPLDDLTNDILTHHGIKGQKWGVRRFQNNDGSLTPAGKERYYVESDKQIITNKDGSNTVPKGYKFNRVGGAQMKANASGALYVSSGKTDVDKYIKMFGPTKLSIFTNKAKGGLSDTIQHITVKEDLRMPNETQLSKLTNDFLLSNKKVLNSLIDNEEAFINMTYDPTSKIQEIDESVIKKLAANPDDNYAKRVTYGVSTILGNSNYAEEAKAYYDYLKKQGYDAIPDLNDRYNGTTETATIVFNTDKIECTSTKTITKDVINSGAKYINEVCDLPISEVFKS